MVRFLKINQFINTIKKIYYKKIKQFEIDKNKGAFNSVKIKLISIKENVKKR